MYSDKPRCRYGINPLSEVICQFYFPEIQAIAASSSSEFLQMIQDQYPRFQRRMEIPAPKIVGRPGQFQLENQPGVINCQFVSADDIWRVNLTSRFISLSCARYTCWEEFAAHLDKPLVAFLQLYRPEYFQRIGLRYRNIISRKALGLEEKKFSELFAPSYLGPLADPEANEETASRCGLDMEMAIRGGCRMQLRSGPIKEQWTGNTERETKFLFDQDFYIAGNIPPHLSAAALNTLHNQAWAVFRGAITDTLHDAMKPQRV